MDFINELSNFNLALWSLLLALVFTFFAVRITIQSKDEEGILLFYKDFPLLPVQHIASRALLFFISMFFLIWLCSFALFSSLLGEEGIIEKQNSPVQIYTNEEKIDLTLTYDATFDDYFGDDVRSRSYSFSSLSYNQVVPDISDLDLEGFSNRQLTGTKDGSSYTEDVYFTEDDFINLSENSNAPLSKVESIKETYKELTLTGLEEKARLHLKFYFDDDLNKNQQELKDFLNK